MNTFRELLQRRGGILAAGVLLAIAGGVLWMSIRAAFGPSEAASLSARRTFICAQTGRAFEHVLRAGDDPPVRSPYSGAATGFPAELCYWNADGTSRQKPTAVLLNCFKGQAEPTFCPDCGRLVIPHNPAPRPGAAPPPRQEDARLAGFRMPPARRD